MSGTAAIIGGGIGGLSAAYFLLKFGRSAFNRIILLESSDRIGGWIRTERSPDDNIRETGPRSLRCGGIAGRAGLKLADELLIADQVISARADDAAVKTRLIYTNGKLVRLPQPGPGAILWSHRRISPKPIILHILSDILSRRKPMNPDDTVYNFMSSRIGRTATEQIIDPVFRGIYAADIRELSAKTALPYRAYEIAHSYGSIIRGARRLEVPAEENNKNQLLALMSTSLTELAKREGWVLWSFKDGLETLPKAILEHLLKFDSVQVRTSCPVASLNFQKSSSADSNAVTIETAHGEKIKCDHVFSSVSAKELSKLLSKSTEMAWLSDSLNRIKFVSVATVNLEYPFDTKLPIAGFGHLIPSTEIPHVLGIIYDSLVFPQQNNMQAPRLRLTVMLGGSWFEQHFGSPTQCNKTQMLDTAVDAVSTQLKISHDPLSYLVSIHQDCIPLYRVAHSDFVTALNYDIRRAHLPLSLLGSSYKGIGVNDCILNSLVEVDRVTQRFANLRKTGFVDVGELDEDISYAKKLYA